MLKKLKVSVSLIVLGEVLYWALEYFANTDNSIFSELLTGILLGLSVGMKLLGIILLIVCIVKTDTEVTEKKD